MVAVSGRVVTSDGGGIRNVHLTIARANGATQQALTGSFGYFRFDDVEAGQTYIISVTSKRYQFANPAQLISVANEITDLMFNALP